MKRCAALGSVAIVALFGAASASGHNAGHVFTSNDSCHNVGSFKDAPFVPEQNPHRNTTPGSDFGRLDLIPGPPAAVGTPLTAGRRAT